MARPRRKSEAPKLRVIQGGAQALVSREARPRSERPDLVASATRRSLEPVAPLARERATPDEPEAETPTAQAQPASNQRKLMAVAIAFAAAVLVYLLLRRR